MINETITRRYYTLADAAILIGRNRSELRSWCAELNWNLGKKGQQHKISSQQFQKLSRLHALKSQNENIEFRNLKNKI